MLSRLWRPITTISRSTRIKKSVITSNCINHGINRFNSTAATLSYDQIPSPPTDPVYGAWKEFNELGGLKKGLQTAVNFWKKYGDILKIDLKMGINTVSVYHPDDVEWVLNNETKWPSGSVVTIWTLQYFMERKWGKDHSSVMMLQNERWKEMRKALQKDIFSPREAAELFPVTISATEKAIDVYPQWLAGENRGMFYTLLSFDLLQNVLFGSSTTNIWSDDFQKSTDYSDILTGMKAFAKMMDLAFGTPKEMVPKDELENWYNDMDQLFNYFDRIIAKIMKDITNISKSKNPPYIVNLLARNELDYQTVLCNIGSFLFAALDTTAVAIQWLLLHLSRNPQVQEKLYQEVINVVGVNGEVQKEHYNQLTYLKQCMKESFRLTPTTGAVVRFLPEDITIRNYNIPAGTMIQLMTLPYCYDPNIFERPDEFFPERWSKEAKEKRKESNSLHDHPYMLLPFGIGPRMCIGARVAEVEIMSFVISLLRQYSITLNPNSPLPESISHGTSKPVPSPDLILTKRQ